jgi:hypothetical protein
MMHVLRRLVLVSLIAGSALLGGAACGDDDTPAWTCQIAPGTDPDSAAQIGCRADYDLLASTPPSAAISGAVSVKTVFDRFDATLHFQNSKRYKIHWEFASKHLSGKGKPIVPQLAQFNTTEYYSPDRRFILGALTHYRGPDVWVYEISPYDTASAELITTAYRAIRDNSFIGDKLAFHPTSEAVETVAKSLPADVKVVSTDDIFKGVKYQPLNLGTSMGRLAFVQASQVDTVFVSYRDIVVLDAVPNDIGVAQGLITGVFQTPLSHLTVLSQNRGTPNMGLRGGWDDPALRALEGKWIELKVGAFEYSIREVTQAEADQWWNDHRPAPVEIPAMDLATTDFRDADKILDDAEPSLRNRLKKAIPAFGGKASHYSGLTKMGSTVPHPKAFGVPLYWYDKFMKDNGLYGEAAAMIADPAFKADPSVREAKLKAFRTKIEATPLDPPFEQAILAKLAADYPAGIPFRFRSSTNSEDLFGFTGAGLYESHTGNADDPLKPVAGAIRETWGSIWTLRAYEEREYRSIPHLGVGMALLVHPSFPDEEANGVALTANIFDAGGLEPGFWINVQFGETSVVKPPDGVTTDEIVYYHQLPGQPAVYLSHSSLVPKGTTVLTREQLYALGTALQTIHDYYSPAYGPAGGASGFYAMDVEFKFDGAPGQTPTLAVKQCRPHPGWGLAR